MFNAPRPKVTSTLHSSMVFSSPTPSPGFNPLAFDAEDPWSSAPSPSHSTPALSTVPSPAPPAPMPPPSSGFGFSIPALASSSGSSDVFIDEDVLPAIYFKALESVSSGRAEADLSVTALSRLLRTADGLGASDLERILNICSADKPRIVRRDILLSLVLVGLAQEGIEPSLDEASLRRSNPPTPRLDLDSISTTPAASTASFNHSSTPSILSIKEQQLSAPPPSPPRAPPAVRQTSTDPWASAGGPSANTYGQALGTGQGVPSSYPSSIGGAQPAGIRGGLLAIDRWWESQIQVSLRLVPEPQGSWLKKYSVFEISTSGNQLAVARRYSEFTWLWDCLVKRYPFRCLVGLPPKRIGAEGSFLETRRRGLVRFLSYVINHPTLKQDHLVQVFLTEPNLEQWRKTTPITLEEELKGKKLSEREEMEIPGDALEKLDFTRHQLVEKISVWSNLVNIFERQSRRLEALGADASRFSVTLASLVETSSESWKGKCVSRLSTNGGGGGGVASWGGAGAAEDVADELGTGVNDGLRRVGRAFEDMASSADSRSQRIFLSTLEQLKTQRDLFISFRELFARFDRLSPDPVAKLEKRIESASVKLHGIRQARKPNWEVEADKIAGAIEADQAAVEGWIARRSVIRSIMWQEMAYVMHPRSLTLVTLAWQQFAKEEVVYAGAVEEIWKRLDGDLQDMPLE